MKQAHSSKQEMNITFHDHKEIDYPQSENEDNLTYDGPTCLDINIPDGGVFPSNYEN